MTFEGQFVRLVPLELGHAPALALAGAEERSSYAFTTVPTDEREAREFITAALADRDRGAAVPFATIDARTHHVVGSTRFMNVERWAAPFTTPPAKDAKPDVLEIGATWLSASAQRTAINTEAKLLMLRHAFETWTVYRVTLKTDARNARSRTAIERLGAKPDGILRAWQLAADGGPRDTAIYSILLAEWPAVRARLEQKLSQRAAATP